MSLAAGRHTADNTHGAKGTEVFVGGLPRRITEDKIKTVFSSSGEIAEIRMIKDTNGNTKGYCFVRFTTKQAADKAVKEITGTMIDGKKIGVLPSVEQNTLFFGNLKKDWSTEELERIVRQIFPDVESVDLGILKDALPGQKKQNRGFAFVRFTSHAAASRAQRLGSQPTFLLGNVHPTVRWAEEQPEIDAEELSKVKIAFIRNIPINAEESYLKQLFEPFGKVEKVVLSGKGSSRVGFVHFEERSDLERAVEEMNEKSIQGPNDGLIVKLQVEIARPMEKNKKRGRDNSQTNPTVHGISKILKEEQTMAPPRSHIPLVQREIVPVEPYEEAVFALPLAVKERLLRILRLGIASRFDVDFKSLRDLRELPEHISISILDQFMLSGSTSQNKGAYLSALISGHLVNMGLNQSSLGFSDATVKQPDHYGFSYSTLGQETARSDIHAQHYVPSIAGYGLPVRAPEERQLDLILQDRYGSPSIQQFPRTTRLEERSYSPLDTMTGQSLSSYANAGVRSDEQHISWSPIAPTMHDSSLSYPRQGFNNLSSAVAERQQSRPSIRFDPFTGEPYKFDPFTGEPLEPASTSRTF